MRGLKPAIAALAVAAVLGGGAAAAYAADDSTSTTTPSTEQSQPGSAKTNPAPAAGSQPAANCPNM